MDDSITTLVLRKRRLLNVFKIKQNKSKDLFSSLVDITKYSKNYETIFSRGRNQTTRPGGFKSNLKGLKSESEDL